MNLTKSTAYRNLFLLAFCSLFLLMSTVINAQTPPCQNPTRVHWRSASLSPICGLKNGSISITIPAPYSQNYTAVLMYRKYGTNEPLQPYLGASSSTSMSGGQATITYNGLEENYYCIVISSGGSCFNEDVELACCPPTKVQWAKAKRHPLCNLNDGEITIRVSNQVNPLYPPQIPVYGQVRVTLMYRPLGTNEPLKPYPGAEVYNVDLGIQQNAASNPKTFDLTWDDLAPNYYCILVQAYHGCFNVDIELDCKNNPVCTYTQGGWGSEGGKMSDGVTATKYTTIQLINQSLGNWGGTMIIGSQEPGGSWLTVTSAQQVLEFLPNGGPNVTLNHIGGRSISAFLSSYKLKKGGSLIAQALALGLNLGINAPADAHLANIPLQGIVDPAVIAVLSDKTVGGLYAFANRVIGLGESAAMGLSLSAIADAMDAVNNYFVECKMYKAPGSASVAVASKNAIGASTATLAKSRVNVVAGPNPFRNRVQFVLATEVSGQGVLEVYNVAGVRVATPFRGYVAAGKAQTINYTAPSLANNGLVYVFRVNGEQVSGKLIAAK
ncbi:hypothetical protein HRH25_10425 [Flavisolibacter sp. BT320]|nr:hypothetical protein [Flavisolibacter longurius]